MGQKRKYCDHRGWERIISSSYAKLSVIENEFDGHLTLYVIHQVREPLYVPGFGHATCIADAGYSWLQQISRVHNFVVTTMFDENGQIVQWYIDIRSGMGVGRDGVPWFDDLYLDLVVSPNGHVELLDADELQDALDTGIIDQTVYDQAWQEARHLQTLVERKELKLLSKAEDHRRRLLPLVRRTGLLCE